MSIDLYSEDLLAVDEHGFDNSEDEDDPSTVERVIDGEIEPEDQGGNDDESRDGGQAAGGGKIKEPKKARVNKNPQPKLNVAKLKERRGIPALTDTFKDFKFTKGREVEDLDRMLEKMEHWAHRLSPHLTFQDFLKQAEKLGAKQEMKNYVNRVRSDMVLDDPMMEVADNDDDMNNVNEDQQHMESRDSDDPPPNNFDNLLDSRSQPQSSKSPPPPPMVLTDEQIERMRVNRLAAITKRLAKQKAEQEQLQQPLPHNNQLSLTNDEKMSTVNEHETSADYVTNIDSELPSSVMSHIDSITD